MGQVALQGASGSAERAEPTRCAAGWVLFTSLLSTGLADRLVTRKEAAMATAALPQDPDLGQLRNQARELQRAVGVAGSLMSRSCISQAIRIASSMKDGRSGSMRRSWQSLLR